MTTREQLYDVLEFGTEREPVVLIDDFSSTPEDLLAMGQSAQFKPGGNHYPGMRAAAPPTYLGERAGLLKDILIDVFGMTQGADLAECSFSIVTTPPDQLTPIQRLPHFDGTDRGGLALLHYLCSPDRGGTSFYRHRATGFETITETRLQGYDAALRAEAVKQGLPRAFYFTGSSPQFERIGHVEAHWNRMVIYRGRSLHSGDIRALVPLGSDARTARLTVNTFLTARGTPQ